MPRALNYSCFDLFLLSKSPWEWDSKGYNLHLGMIVDEQRTALMWQMIDRFGKEINHPDSIYYWAHKNDIPVYCPPLTDGSIGDMLFFHSYKKPGLRCDIIEDIRRMNDEALKATPRKTGIIILGGGMSSRWCQAAQFR